MENLRLSPTGAFSLRDTVDYASDSIVSKVITKNAAGNVTLFAFDKGQQLSEHTAPFDAMVTVLDGEGTVTIGGTAYLLKEGEAIIMPADIPHAVDAGSRFKMMLIMIKAPR